MTHIYVTYLVKNQNRNVPSGYYTRLPRTDIFTKGLPSNVFFLEFRFNINMRSTDFPNTEVLDFIFLGFASSILR
jgi:hypothetical protein